MTSNPPDEATTSTDSPLRVTHFLLGYGVFAALIYGYEWLLAQTGAEVNIGVELAVEVLAAAIALFVVTQLITAKASDYGLPILTSDRWGFVLAIPLLYGLFFAISPFQAKLEDLPSQLGNYLVDLRVGGAMVGAILALVVLIPLFEEVMFRGILYGAIDRTYGRWAAVIGSAAVYALIHVPSVSRASDHYGLRVALLLTLAFGLGIALGYARLRTNRIGLSYFINVGWSTVFVLSYLLLDVAS